jgi:hypothetical protein
VLVLLLGVTARLWLATTTLGTNDIEMWRRFAQVVADRGPLGIYAVEPLYNHPPLMGLLAAAALLASRAIGIPFAHCFKLPGLGADVLTAWLIRELWRKRGEATGTGAAALFLLNPLSIAMSGYHGNTDPLYAALGLLSVFLAQERGRPFAAGLALGAAVNVKLIPVLLAPAILARLGSSRDRLRFLAGGAVLALPFLWAAVGAGAPFVANVFSYFPNINRWGVSFLIGEAVQVPALASAALALGGFARVAGKYVILGSILALTGTAHARGRLTIAQAAAGSIGLFLVLTPGFGLQYLAVGGALLFAVDLERATLYSWLAGGCAVVTYVAFNLPGTGLSDHSKGPIPIFAALLGLLAWAVLVDYVARRVREVAASPVVASPEA